MPPFQVGLFIIGRPVAFITMMATMTNATNTDAMMIHIMLNCFIRFVVGSTIIVPIFHKAYYNDPTLHSGIESSSHVMPTWTCAIAGIYGCGFLVLFA